MQNSKTDSTNRAASKAVSRSPSKASIQSKRNTVKSGNTPRGTSLGNGRSSNTSIFSSRRTDLNSEDSPAKLKSKFTQPRMNRLTELRIKRLQNAQTSAAKDDKANGHSQKLKRKEKNIVVRQPTSLQSSEVGDVELSTTCPAQSSAPPPPPCPTPPCLPPEVESMRIELQDLQSRFMAKLNDLRLEDCNISCKIVALVQDGNCQLILNKEDLIALPKNIPVQSVSDFKSRCREAMHSGYKLMLEKFKPNEACSKEFRTKLQEKIDNELEVINSELDKLCITWGLTDKTLLKPQSGELLAKIEDLTDASSKLKIELMDIRKTRDELMKTLDEVRTKNKDLAIELADKNIAFVEQSVVEDDLRNEVKQLKKANKIIQQRIKDMDATRDQSQASITATIVELEKKLDQALADKELAFQRSKELTERIAVKEHQLAELQKQLNDLEQSKVWQDVQTEQSSNHSADQLQIHELQAKLAVNQRRLESMVEEEKQLREELEQRRELQTMAESKVSRLEDAIEYHRQVLAVRGDRINYLDREMKQREQESNRKLNEVMSQASAKNTIITQITNELASTNEQFQNLCSTLSIKQTKLHSQEHVIKLLEESNARSVKLHTKLGEKNALLKDELEHLRRTVKNLMLGSGVNDAEVKDILME